MIELFRNPKYDFIGKRRWAYLVSGLATLIGLVTLLTQGLHYDIDFTGGTLIQVRFEKPPSVAAIRAGLSKIGLGESVIQEFGASEEFILRLPLTAAKSEEIAKKVQGALSGESGLGPFEIRRVEFVGPQVGKELQWEAMKAVLWSLIGILVYIAFRLLVGVITGTYSTTYVAAALVVDWTSYVEGRLRRGKKAVAKAQ